ncbi:uncharacterized protein LOC117114335 [Anneissia japonica]|uniref:uncharacterized protein LOC117114335 n=1 Tax=Anneissia japonica TaxID=1529436 RepID=UPI0014255251|nr:uncharacterized protein LOC117114335 [Anneissia japonica]XP_033113875.1 uncharacterized protein LOC117114335 [Anneissia japonica]XP_033113876.1 uncharacterized protein LOC117114335 [Anneissia japonica]
MSFVKEELDELSKKCTSEVDSSELITCHQASVRVKLRKTKFKNLVVCLQFGDDYPSSPIIIELKSKTISEKLLHGICNIADAEAKKYLGTRQVLPVLKFIRQFLEDNAFAVCSDELSFIKKELITPEDEIKVKQKSGVLTTNINQKNYFMKLKFTIPNNYPEEQASVEQKETNFPDLFQKMCIAQATEMARQCVAPPLKKKPKDLPFEAKPSLKFIAEFLIRGCIQRYPMEKCVICKETAFPADPNHVVNDPQHGRHVEWVYCGHLFHHGCLSEYMKTPPFTGGKKCPSCGKRVYHEKWKIAPKTAEERWAHEQARQRELEEVVDFLG